MSSTYPQELRTPPLPLVAFIRGAENHKEIGSFFSHVLRPPMITVGVAEPHEQLLAKLFGNRKPISSNQSAPAGIIKADWFLKHRNRKASVAIVIVARREVEGDPTTWNNMLYQLKAVRDAATGRNAGVIVAVMQDAGGTDVPADRIAAVCSHLQLEARCLVTLNRPANMPAPTDREKVRYEADLKAMGKLAQELACEYYRAEAQRRAQKHSVRVAQMGGTCPAEISARVAFKLAVMAEFRQEWGEGITLYQAAYSHVKEVQMGNPLSYQRHAEVTRVAEQVHYKVMMLLLHQNRYEEAMTQFKTHIAIHLKPPEPLPPVAQSAHLGWAARQFQVAAEMLRAKLEANTSLAPHRECQPAYLQLSAAQASIRRRQAAESARQSRLATPLAIDVSSVKRGPFVGQVVLRTDSGSRDLSDAEYLLYLEAEEAKVHHTAVNLELLSSALMLFKDTRYERMRSQLGVLMAQEHFLGNSLPNARKLLLQVCHTYRRDGWEEAVVQVLGQLRECAQRLKNPREYVAFTLEITSMPNSLDEVTNKNTARVALATLLSGVSAIKASIIKTPSPERTPASASASASGGESTSSPPAPHSPTSSRFDYVIEHLDLKDIQRHARSTQDARGSLSADLLIRHHQQDFGWWRCIALSAGFSLATPDPSHIDFHLCLCNNLPVNLPLQRIEVQFADEVGDFVALAQLGAPADSAAASATQQGCSSSTTAGMSSTSSSVRSSLIASPREQSPGIASPAEVAERLATMSIDASTTASVTSTAAPVAGGGWGSLASGSSLSLKPGRWQQLYTRVCPRCVGKLRVTQVIMVVSDHSALTWKLDTFPAGQTSLGNLHLMMRVPPFRRFPSVLPGLFTFNVQHVGALPKLELQVSPSPLVHQHSQITATITTPTHLTHAELEFSFKSLDAQIKADDLALHLPSSSTSTTVAPSPSSETSTVPSTHQLANLDSHRMQIQDLIPGSTHTITIYLRASKEGRVVVTATMFCPMIIHESAELHFHPAFEIQTSVMAETNVHTLGVPAKPPPVAGGAGQMPVGPPPPLNLPLTIGQPVLVAVAAKALSSCRLQMLDASVELAPDSGLQLLNDLRQQVDPGGLPLNQGDLQTILVHVLPTRIATCPSMGRLLLKFRRLDTTPFSSLTSPCSPSPTPPSKINTSLPSPSDASTPTDPACASTSSPLPDSPSTPHTPPYLQELSLPFSLPPATIQDGILTVRSTTPPQATVGMAFTFNIQVQNSTPLAQELQVVVAEAPGFTFEGDKSQILTVPPKDKNTVTWLLTARASGQLPLPMVRVTAIRYNCQVACQRSHVYVLPF